MRAAGSGHPHTVKRRKYAPTASLQDFEESLLENCIDTLL
jgi:hypothetical protein